MAGLSRRRTYLRTTGSLIPVANRTLTDRTDVELAALAQDGRRDALEALIDRYRRFARAKSRGYFLVGGDADDIEQEALIGLYKAARDFRPEHQASFRAFAVSGVAFCSSDLTC